jgi:hypothetical protein
VKKFLFIIFLFITAVSFAQQNKMMNYQQIDMKWFHFGYTLGFNTMDFSVYPSQRALKNDTFPEINRLSPGVDIGIVTNFKINNHLDFRFLPGISLGQRNVLFYDKEDKAFSEMKIGSTFINLPFIFKLRAERIRNYRPYLVAGVNLRYDMARNKDFNADEEIYIKLMPFDAYFEGGFGIDFYLPYFKFSTEIKYSVGTFNVLSPEKHDTYPGYVSSIDKLKSRMVILSFHFE